MPIEAARYLVIRCFTASMRGPADTSGLSLLLATWLDIARPTVAIRKDGKTVTGYVQDLTG